MTTEYDTARDALVGLGRGVLASVERGGNRQLSRGEGALLLMAMLAAQGGWRFSLTDSGQLHTVVGDPIDHLTIPQTLEVLGRLAPMCELALCLVTIGLPDGPARVTDRVQ